MEENKKEEEAKNTTPGFKKMKLLILVVIGMFVLIILSNYGYQKYDDWKFDKELKELTEEINKPYLEDSYGGKTPKETLELFIAAVEKEDFELASKYFVLSKQEEWKNKLINGKENNSIKNLIKLVADEIEILNKAEPLWIAEDRYISTNKVLFEYVKYPQGIWKIKEI